MLCCPSDRSTFPWWHALTCCEDGAAARNVACSAGTRYGTGTARPVCPAGCAPVGWRHGIVVAEASGGRRGRNPDRAESCLGSGSSTCGHTACPWAATEAGGRCGTPARHPPRPDIQTGDCPDHHDTVHIPYTPAPTLCHTPVETPWAPSWPEEVKLDVRRAGELMTLSQLANSKSASSDEKQSTISNPEREQTASRFI